MAKRRKVGNLLALALLGLLAPGQHMHPYEMANLLRRTGKDQDMKVKWGSLYTVVQNLDKHGFIEQVGSDRTGRRPERTVYAITEAGRVELRDWIRELVAVPSADPPRFEVALSVVGVLPPDEIVDLLHQRVRAIDADLAAQRAQLAQVPDLARVFLVEAEYAIAMRAAEAAWIRGLLAEIEANTLSGLDEWRAYHENGFTSPQWTQLLKEIAED